MRAERIFSEETPGSSVPVSGSVHAYIKRWLIQHKEIQHKEKQRDKTKHTNKCERNL